MNYVISLNCKVDARNQEEAKAKALMNIQVREAAPLMLAPLDVYECLEKYRKKQKEYFITCLLDTQNNLLGFKVIAVGTLNTSLVHPREVFRPAIAANCASIIVAHNHPSGTLEPSPEDVQVTKRLKESGKLIGIELTDHVIITMYGFYSFREHHLL